MPQSLLYSASIGLSACPFLKGCTAKSLMSYSTPASVCDFQRPCNNALMASAPNFPCATVADGFEPSLVAGAGATDCPEGGGGALSDLHWTPKSPRQHKKSKYFISKSKIRMLGMGKISVSNDPVVRYLLIWYFYKS